MSTVLKGSLLATAALALVGSLVAAADFVEGYPLSTGQALRYALAAAVREAAVGASWVTLSGSLPPGSPADGMAVLIDAARSAGALVALDAREDDLRAGVRSMPDLVKVNEHEAADLLRANGLEPGSAAEELARTLRQQLGCASVIVSLGAAGACVVDAANDEWVASPQVRAVDTTGAGDVLVGVVAARLSQGWGIVPATRDACAVAARAVTTRGARGYLDANA